MNDCWTIVRALPAPNHPAPSTDHARQVLSHHSSISPTVCPPLQNGFCCTAGPYKCMHAASTIFGTDFDE